MIDTDDIGANESGNPRLADMIEAQLSRRSVLTGGVALAATGFFGGSLLQSGQATARSFGSSQALGFEEVPASDADAIIVPDGYNWHKAEPRFDLARNRNELNHFGWVVEIDPFDPTSTPVKRTALARIKHEGATCTESKGRIVVYSGDDENGDHLCKFVGDRPWRQVRAKGQSPLDHGTLYVAKFSDDGSGRWLPLVHGVGPLTVANGWADQADVLIRTRMAADAVGATRLHRPE